MIFRCFYFINGCAFIDLRINFIKSNLNLKFKLGGINLAKYKKYKIKL